MDELEGQDAKFEVLDELHAKIVRLESELSELRHELTLRIREAERLQNLNTSLCT